MQMFDKAYFAVKFGARRVANKLQGKLSGDQTIVVALILIAIAVGLCIAFRNTVADIMKTITDKVKTAVESMIAGSVTEPGP